MIRLCAGIVATALVAFATSAVASMPSHQPASAAPVDFSIGDPHAPVTVIEYASITCPHCARFASEIFPAFKAQYVDTGKVRYVFRETPIHGSIDVIGYVLARCVAPSKYFNVIDAVMRDQDKVFANPRDAYLDIAKSAGLTEKQFDACESNEDNVHAVLDRSHAEMDEYSIEATPTFIINGKPIEPGVLTLEQLSAEIDPLLAKK
jgi:protein-disulfide isomerase